MSAEVSSQADAVEAVALPSQPGQGSAGGSEISSATTQIVESGTSSNPREASGPSTKDTSATKRPSVTTTKDTTASFKHDETTADAPQSGSGSSHSTRSVDSSSGGSKRRSTHARILPDRPKLEVARDTKRILEICYGKTTGTKKTPAENTEPTEDATGDATGDDTGTGAAISRKEKRKKRRGKKKAKRETTEGTTQEEKAPSEGADVSSGTTKKKKRKKRRVRRGVVTRDAAGKVIRRRKKGAKGRSRMVSKDCFRKGKDAKIDLSTIAENGEEESDDDCGNESCEYYTTSGGEEDDCLGEDGSVSDGDSSDSDSSSDEEIDGDKDDESEAHARVQNVTECCESHEAVEIVSGQDDVVVSGEGTEGEGNGNGNETISGQSIGNSTNEISLSNEAAPTANQSLESSLENHNRTISDIEAGQDSTNTTERIVDSLPSPADVEDPQASAQSISSVESTACTSTASPVSVKPERTLVCFGNRRNVICAGVLFVVTVAAATVMVVYFVTFRGDFEGPPVSSPVLVPTPAPQGGLRPVVRPNEPPFPAPSPAPTPALNALSTSCLVPENTPNVTVLEAEDAPEQFGIATISDANTGFCGDGYLSNLSAPGSGFGFVSFRVNATGYYKIDIRYNHAAETETSLRLQINDRDEDVFDLISTGNETSWRVVGVDDVLLREGAHNIRLFADSDDPVGPNVDWVTVALQEPLPRDRYLLGLIARSNAVAAPTVSKRTIEWMAEEDLIDWSTLSDAELIERYALVVIYRSTRGGAWTMDDRWLSEYHVCGWYGIGCSNDMLVTELMLDENGLDGGLSEEVLLLTNLVSISLDSNRLAGLMPTQISKLTNLSYLSLYNNFFSGLLLTEITSFSNLKTIDLRSNFMYGDIPTKIYAMTGLETLALGGNYLGGTLSTDIGNLKALKDLDLHFSELSGTLPTELGELTLLTNLDLGYNRFSGPIPGELGLLTNLKVLNITNNQLTGTLPPELDLLKDAQVDYSENDLSL